MDQQLEEYILNHISPEPDNLRSLNRKAHAELLYGHMCSGHLQGRVLKMLTQMIAPKRVLELGTYVGYSALCIAQGLDDPDAQVHTIDIDDEMEDVIREQLELDPAGKLVTLHIGDALEIVPQLPGEWDMVVIDANKRDYLRYYEMILPRMRRGGFILADNTLWAGKVTDLDTNHDALTRGVAEFNDFVARDPRVEVVILPMRDGLTIIHVL